MIFLTRDCHFNNKNIIKYESDSRGQFDSIEEMNETIIQNWNSVVNNEDTVYVLGDFFMGHISTIEPILNRLKGKIILIRGNQSEEDRRRTCAEHGSESKDIEYIEYKGKFFILSHFPLFNEEFAKMVNEDNEEVVVLYGHIHSNAPKGFVDGTYHVGMDTNNLTPISIEQIWQECSL